MISLSELVAGQQEGKIVPSPRLRTCSFCGGQHEFDDDWACGGCGEVSQFHTEFETCSGCGQRITQRYSRNRVMQPLNRFGKPCWCGLDESQVAELVAVEEDIRRAEAEERAKAGKLKALHADASECWAASGYECSVPTSKQLPMCKFCTRFKSSSTFRGKK